MRRSDVQWGDAGPGQAVCPGGRGGHIHCLRHVQVTPPRGSPHLPRQVPALRLDSYSLWLKTKITFLVSNLHFSFGSRQGEAQISLSQGGPWFPSLCVSLCLGLGFLASAPGTGGEFTISPWATFPRAAGMSLCPGSPAPRAGIPVLVRKAMPPTQLRPTPPEVCRWARFGVLLGCQGGLTCLHPPGVSGRQ